jgi:hypothetical protein
LIKICLLAPEWFRTIVQQLSSSPQAGIGVGIKIKKAAVKRPLIFHIQAKNFSAC